MERYRGVGSIEDQLRNLSEAELLVELGKAGKQLQNIGVNTPIPMLIAEGLVHGERESFDPNSSESQDAITLTPLNLIRPLLYEEPDLRTRLSHDQFCELLESVTRLAMVSEMLLEKTGAVDYQAAGFPPPTEWVKAREAVRAKPQN